MPEQRTDRKLDGCQGSERRCAKTRVELIQRHDVAEARAGVEVILTTARGGMLPERVPVAAETVVIYSAERLRRGISITHVHAAPSQDLHLLGIRLEPLDVHTHEHRLRK